MEINIENNKKTYINLLKLITRRGADVDGLISLLDGSDFFTAPATTKTVRSYSGGLCEHSLERYYTLCKICDSVSSDYCNYGKDTILIVSLLADLGKIGYFEKTIKNKKVYNDKGKKYDEMGNFDWVSEEGWAVKDPSERFIYGTLGQNAERVISEFIPLTDEEASTIINLHSDYENPNLNIVAIYQKYPLLALLNSADKIASFVNVQSADNYIPF